MRAFANAKQRSSSSAAEGREPHQAGRTVREPGPHEPPQVDWSFSQLPVQDPRRVPPFSVLSQGAVQCKLMMNEPGDRYEQEADHVAEQVMRTPEAMLSAASPGAFPHIQRKCASCAEGKKCAACQEEEERQSGSIQRKSLETTGLQSGIAPFAGLDIAGGSRIPEQVRHRIEAALRTDLGHVRVHSDDAAHDAARQLQAKAFTYRNHIWLGKGENAGDTALMAHESAHVVQQTGLVHRKDDKDTKPDKKPAPKPPTAADAPKLDVTNSKNGPPCACIVVVHNAEENARKTAQLMFENCAYNLTLLNPDDHNREIKIPGNTGTVDPNSLFPKAVAEQCMADEKSCQDFLTNKAGSTDKADIKKAVEIQFFLAIKNCSKSFSLPVVALHNNAVDDTAKYRADTGPKTDFSKDVDKSKKETGEDVVKALKKALAKKYGEPAQQTMTDKKGQTNIFRWCASNDISRCHIGDPDHPDNITWVTNPKDFDTLSKKPINVALQTDTAKSVGSESEGDLSTLFLILRDLKEEEILDLMVDAFEAELDLDDFTAWLDDLAIEDIMDEEARLRYINIETPGKPLSAQSDAERARNYDAIVEVLKAAGLHCCGADPAAAEKKIKEGLKIPKPEPKDKPKDKPKKDEPKKKAQSRRKKKKK